MVHTLIQSSLGYPGLWLACAGSGILVPMPEDVPLLYAGTRIATGMWSWPATLLVAWIGVGLRDISAWAIGRYLVRWLLETRIGWWLGGRRLQRAERLISSHGPAAVLIGRFLIGFRAPVFMAAGAMGVPVRAFAAYDAIGLTLAIPITVGLGYWFGAPITEVAAALLQRASSVAALCVAIGVGWWLWRSAFFSLAAQGRSESDEVDPGL